MSQYQIIITENEARTLLALSHNQDATLGELAAATRLPPSEVQTIVSHLNDKQLALFDQKKQYVQLLESGRRLSTMLTRRQNRAAIQSREYQSVIIVPDEIKLGGLPELDELDKAISEELSKLE